MAAHMRCMDLLAQGGTHTYLAGRHGQALGGGASASMEKVQVTCCSRRPWHSICSRRRRGSGTAGRRAWQSLACCAEEGVSAGRRRVGNRWYTGAAFTLLLHVALAGLPRAARTWGTPGWVAWTGPAAATRSSVSSPRLPCGASAAVCRAACLLPHGSRDAGTRRPARTG